jgi:hypothetical protein
MDACRQTRCCGASIETRPSSPCRFFWNWGAPAFYVDTPLPLVAPGDVPIGGVQLDVTPWRSQVYVDGMLMGRVDDFRGYYHPLRDRRRTTSDRDRRRRLSADRFRDSGDTGSYDDVSRRARSISQRSKGKRQR